MTSVVVKELIKRYGDVPAVRGIDLTIAEGEFLVLLGPSGCGKTTTLRCIAGLEEISDGEILMGGQVVSAKGHSVPPEKRRIGMVFQSYAIWPHMSVAENVAFGLKLRGLPKAEIDDRVSQSLTMVGLGAYASRGASQLSGGQQQRVAFARAIALEPGVLLFDEPLSNLDAKLRERMRFELRELQARLGITSIYVTHDQQEAMVIADRVVLMNDGRIDQMGPPAEIYSRPVSRFSAEFIGLANILPGEVVSNGSGTKVRLVDGLELHSRDTGFKVGEKVDAVCRPENLVFSPEPRQGPNCFEAELSANHFLGNIADVCATSGQLSLRGQLSPPERWDVGKRLWVELPPERVVLLRSDRVAEAQL